MHAGFYRASRRRNLFFDAFECRSWFLPEKCLTEMWESIGDGGVIAEKRVHGRLTTKTRNWERNESGEIKGKTDARCCKPTRRDWMQLHINIPEDDSRRGQISLYLFICLTRGTKRSCLRYLLDGLGIQFVGGRARISCGLRIPGVLLRPAKLFPLNACTRRRKLAWMKYGSKY